MSKELPKTYNPKDYEQKIYRLWERAGLFRPKKGKKTFVLMMPPPNVTGTLHIGHALFAAIQDTLTRFHRLIGDETLYLPGTDHAGIATQAVVEKELLKKGIRRQDLGRERFVKEVWRWKDKFHSRITEQLRFIGVSADWSREAFTLDKERTASVAAAFKKLYDKGLIYQGEYLVNWCPKCGTAISDDEVEHKEQKTKLYYFKYDKNFPIMIATARPETKLGDTAVSVNPKDGRYQKYVGGKFEINLDGIRREIKIISDRTVDIKFGSGAVGVTPAHSAADWKVAEEHNLPRIKVIDEKGRMTAEAGLKYAGLKTLEAREKLIAHLKRSGLLSKTAEINHGLAVCYRCGSPIEPLPSLQWFVKTKPLAERAVRAVLGGQIKIIPPRFKKVYFHWMTNIRDWCISRQLWWGHRIPVWRRNTRGKGVNSSGDVFVGITPPSGKGWVQEPDVLDTWFSSALWPFSTLGWPNKSAPDYKKYYPTSVLETGYDILFFWVARMIMLGLELTGKPPFNTVYLHGLVRDEQGRKMSKSLGNIIEPIELINRFGTDAVRMALVIGTTPGNDVNFAESRAKGYRNFANKIWNVARFVLANLPANFSIKGEILEKDKKQLKQTEKIAKGAAAAYQNYQFSKAGEILYQYFWHEFADKIIEESKARIGEEGSREDKESALRMIAAILIILLKLLHPLMPFVTEAVWQNLPKGLKGNKKFLAASGWPK